MLALLSMLCMAGLPLPQGRQTSLWLPRWSGKEKGQLVLQLVTALTLPMLPQLHLLACPAVVVAAAALALSLP